MGNHIKGDHNFSRLFKHLLFLNKLNNRAFFLIFSKYVKLRAATLAFGHHNHNFASFYGRFSAAHWKIENVTKWGLLFDQAHIYIFDQ